ncbi:hypothetical protein N7451_012486 [Penicillium sp. IBT 35674x]|nr:hypothetical protein N7451_012486 [Penicillium sp. IBT 35674x]
MPPKKGTQQKRKAIKPAEGDPAEEDNRVVRTRYDPAQESPTSNRLLNILGPASDEDGGAGYYLCRLTNAGNEALLQLCHTVKSREVWRYPSYEFLVKKTKKDGFKRRGHPTLTLS